MTTEERLRRELTGLRTGRGLTPPRLLTCQTIKDLIGVESITDTYTRLTELVMALGKDEQACALQHAYGIHPDTFPGTLTTRREQYAASLAGGTGKHADTVKSYEDIAIEDLLVRLLNYESKRTDDSSGQPDKSERRHLDVYINLVDHVLVDWIVREGTVYQDPTLEDIVDRGVSESAQTPDVFLYSPRHDARNLYFNLRMRTTDGHLPRLHSAWAFCASTINEVPAMPNGQPVRVVGRDGDEAYQAWPPFVSLHTRFPHAQAGLIYGISWRFVNPLHPAWSEEMAYDGDDELGERFPGTLAGLRFEDAVAPTRPPDVPWVEPEGDQATPWWLEDD